MFIAQTSKRDLLKPQRGGMRHTGQTHAAPLGLGRFAGQGVAIDMSPLWGLARAGTCARRPKRIDSKRSSAFRSLGHTGAVDAFLLMAHPHRSAAAGGSATY